MLKNKSYLAIQLVFIQSKPTEPAVNPIIRKNENSAKSLGKELTINLN